MTILKAAEARKAKSPYQRYQKTPFVYSELYRRWFSAMTAGRKDEADKIGRDHSRRFMFAPHEMGA